MATITKQMNVNQIENVLNAAAKQWSAIFGCTFVESDMTLSFSDWREDCTLLTTDEIFGERWFAIRENGVEYGCKDNVNLRCLQLGAALQTIKIKGNGTPLAEVTIEFK